MKDQLKKEALEALHILNGKIDDAHAPKDHGHLKATNESAKKILTDFDNKLTSMSGEITGWKYDLLSATLKGAHEEVDQAIAAGEQYKMGDFKHAIHKAANALAKVIVKTL